MVSLVMDWRVVSEVPQYMGRPYSLTLEFSNTHSKLRVSLRHDDVSVSEELGPILLQGHIPPEGLAQGLMDRRLRLAPEVEGRVRDVAYGLVSTLDQEFGSCQLH